MSKPEMPESVQLVGGLAERLWNAAALLLESADNLQNALIHRRTQEIWELLAQQQERAAALEQLAGVWKRVIDGGAIVSPELPAARAELRALIGRVSIREQVNYGLARSYLGAVERALANSASSSPGRRVYDKAGRLGARGGSRLLDCAG